MRRTDYNLLATLDVLLTEGSVARAARRLRLSPSAMSRALARLRETTGDPLLVRAGRGLVPTPRAIELREKVARVVQEVEAVLLPQEELDLATLVRTVTLRTSEGFVETFGARIIERVSSEAPGVKLRFLSKLDRDSAPLREGVVDLETGVVGKITSPEVRARALFQDRFIGVVRLGHELSRGKVTPALYGSGQHICLTRGGLDGGPIDKVLEGKLAMRGHNRNIATVVGGFSAALALARSSNLIATVPERHTAGLREGMFSFELPVATPQITISLLWHPRMDADPAHRWLRACVREVCSATSHAATKQSQGPLMR